MIRPLPSLTILFSIFVSAGTVWGQVAAPPRVGTQTSQGNSALRPNSIEPNKPVAMDNKIIKPLPLAADSQASALANIDRSICGQIGDLGDDLKTILPDEISILTKTNGWKTEDQQALVSAWRAGDPTGVYEAWVKGNPQDTAGAEVAARQADVKRLMTRLAQDAEKNRTALLQDMNEFDAALGKIAGPNPAVADIATPVKTLKTWIIARKLIDSATPAKGSVIARIPTGGDVTLVFDPTLAVGTAIVLSDEAILIGREGSTSLVVRTGNAAEALGLPICTGTALAEAEGREVTEGVLILNPAVSRGTINYNLNGNHYVSEPGMQQKLALLANGRPWTIEFDRGESFGPATYRLAPGTYHFTPTDLGWQLYRDHFEIVLDNSQNDQEFNFIFHGEDLTVPARSSRTLKSDYPVVVRFDRGNGTEFVSKWTPMMVGTIQIGVNASDNLWDLFPTNDNRRENLKLKPFNVEKLGKR